MVFVSRFSFSLFPKPLPHLFHYLIFSIFKSELFNHLETVVSETMCQGQFSRDGRKILACELSCGKDEIVSYFGL